MRTDAGLNELLRIATDVAQRAGELARTRRREGVEIAASKSAPEDIVTQADRDTEQLIRGLLADARPGDAFFGEESGGGDGTTGLTWVVDPIDGTVNYAYDIPAWAVSIAVVEGDPDPATWTALAGAVINPTMAEVFSAQAGGGARLNGHEIRANEGVQLSLALVGTGFSYSAERRVHQATVVQRVVEHARDVRRIGSAALDLCSVACGRLDAYYERGLNPWDMAAGALIAAEAGARVAGLRGAPATRDLLIAAHPALFAELEPVLDSADVLGV